MPTEPSLLALGALVASKKKRDGDLPSASLFSSSSSSPRATLMSIPDVLLLEILKYRSQTTRGDACALACTCRTLRKATCSVPLEAIQLTSRATNGAIDSLTRLRSAHLGSLRSWDSSNAPDIGSAQLVAVLNIAGKSLAEFRCGVVKSTSVLRTLLHPAQT